MTPAPETSPDVVELRVPAISSFISTVRLTAASLGAQCELTVDDIEDLRLVVDEAWSLLLPLADADGALTVRFELTPAGLAIQSSIAARDSADVDRSGFAWTVLQALASDVAVQAADGQLTVQLVKRRAVTPA